MPQSADGGADLEGAIDRLYQGPLDRFTADRNLLAATLKKGGDTVAAQQVKALAKPSATAWAVNQAWWRHRDRFQAMLNAGAAERRAHLAWAEGRQADVRGSSGAREAAVKDVTDAALEALGGRKAVAPDAQYRIAGTVEALASSGVPEGEAPGRLTRDLQSSGLDALSALAQAAGAIPRPTIVARGTPTSTAPAALAEAPARATATPSPADRGETVRARKQREAEEAAARMRATELAQARMRAEQFTAALDEATCAADAATAGEAAARAALEALTRRRTDLEAALDEARAEEAAARRTLSNAAAAASRAGLDRARAARDAARAREALDRAETARPEAGPETLP